jgi:hypothetical protein
VKWLFFALFSVLGAGLLAWGMFLGFMFLMIDKDKLEQEE